MVVEMEREKFKAICSECGKECEVPFEPKEGRPVKCNDCFRKGRPQRSSYNDRHNNDRRRDFKKEFDVVCAKCGKKTTVPFKPTQGKPVLCRECFAKSKR